MAKHLLMTGGTGLVGRRLTEILLRAGYRVTVLTRSVPAKSSGGPSPGYRLWDPEKSMLDPQSLEGVDAIIHLAGASVAEARWTEKRKREILESRTQGTQLLVDHLLADQHQVKTVICASAIGWYRPTPLDEGNPKEERVESDPADPGFLGETCRQWEAASEPAVQRGLRVVKFRIGIVLSGAGGALPEFGRTLPIGIAPVMGSGRQLVSWIHIDDLCNMFLYALEHASLSGPYNAVAPTPVDSRTLVRTLARQRNGRRYLLFPVPAFVLKLLLGEMSVEVLKSVRVSASKILQTGFAFQFPGLPQAIAEIYPQIKEG